MSPSLWKPLAGIALFLLALSLIESAIRTLAGPRFKSLLINHTNTPISGVVSGTVATAILQSSSFVSLLMLAFVGARLMPLKNAIAVIIGANLGTTATGWIVATIGFKLSLESLALPLIAAGGLATALIQWQRGRDIANLALAIGLLLLGLQYMKGSIDDVAGLVNAETLANLGAWHYLGIGIACSAIVQSSSATMMIALSALTAGIIGLPDAAAMAIGADLGTTSTVLLGAVGAGSNNKRVALAHFLFNLITDSVGFVLLLPILAALAWIGDSALILVAFHSVMNVLGIALFLPFIDRFAQFLERRFVVSQRRMSRFLGEVSSQVPEAAVIAVERELQYLLERVLHTTHEMYGSRDLQNTDAALPGERLYTEEAVLRRHYADCKEIEGEILTYGMELNRGEMTAPHNERLDGLLGAVRSAVVSLKGAKEAREDLLELADLGAEICDSILDRQALFLGALDSLTAADGALSKAGARELDSRIDDDHLALHEEIVRALRGGQIGERKISTALNVNRVLFYSNRALLYAVTVAGSAQADQMPQQEAVAA